jgi:hypothetical protein
MGRVRRAPALAKTKPVSRLGLLAHGRPVDAIFDERRTVAGKDWAAVATANHPEIPGGIITSHPGGFVGIRIHATGSRLNANWASKCEFFNDHTMQVSTTVCRRTALIASGTPSRPRRRRSERRRRRGSSQQGAQFCERLLDRVQVGAELARGHAKRSLVVRQRRV